MIHKIFSVYDSAVGSYLTPFFAPSKGAALRSFRDAVNNRDHQFNKYAADYTLFELGEFDDNNGSVVMLSTPLSLGVALEFRDVHEIPSLASIASA